MTRTKAVLLSALVWPGLGQVGRGERAKGLVLMAGALAPAVAIGVVVWRAVSAVLPGEGEEVDPVALFAAMHGALGARGPALMGLHLVLGVVWLTAVIDAWRAPEG